MWLHRIALNKMHKIKISQKIKDVLMLRFGYFHIYIYIYISMIQIVKADGIFSLILLNSLCLTRKILIVTKHYQRHQYIK